jgi:hypothetical protein
MGFLSPIWHLHRVNVVSPGPISTPFLGKMGLTPEQLKGVAEGLKLARSKELGGNGGGNNPEQLLAAGYSACFLSAMQFGASQHHLCRGSLVAIRVLTDRERGGVARGMLHRLLTSCATNAMICTTDQWAKL